MRLAVKLLTVLSAVIAARAFEECSKPKITVPSAIRDQLENYNIRDSTVEVFCSSDTNEIIIDAGINEKLRTEIINATTIKAVVQTTASGFYVTCKRFNSTDCFDFSFFQVIDYPTIKRFHCFSDNLLFLHCSWSSDFYYGNYSLSFMTLNRDFITRVCAGRVNSKTHYSCSWDMSNIRRPHGVSFSYASNGSLLITVPLHLQVCNVFECVNQSNNLDVVAVTKLNAPEIINIRADNTHGAILEWRVSDDALWLVDQLDIYCLVEYWIPGIKHNVIQATTIAQRHRTIATHIILPCPGKQYRVRVSCRPVRAAPEYMSDFGFISFGTAPDPKAASLDTVCKVKSIEVNPPVMVYKDQLLRQEVEERLDGLKTLKIRLEEKAATIKKIQRSLF